MVMSIAGSPLLVLKVCCLLCNRGRHNLEYRARCKVLVGMGQWPQAAFENSLISNTNFTSGYPTLSIDRICNGLSDHPDPISVCQPNVNIETIHQIIVKARSSQLPGPANRGFSKIIYVGHSLGSISGNLLHAKYPKDTDISILTGWSSAIQVSLLTNALASGTVPAALANPAKYGTLDPNYLVINSTADFRELLYAGAYDQALFNLDYSLRGTIAVGEGK